MNKAEFQKRYGNSIGQPKLSLLLGEAKTPFEAAKLAVGWRFLARKNVGQGQTVLLLPGFGASSSSMAFIKRYLNSLGYKAVNWSAGFNHGEVGKLLPQVIADIKEHSEQAQGPIKLLGWSLGGYLAREAAREVQQNVSRIVTIGSPVIGGPKYTAVKTLYDIRGLDVESIENSTLKRFEHPLCAPSLRCTAKKTPS
jgi:pimeloyl-ACP methyl ester carboxylesterase